jgi:hypothetical protein
LEHAVQSLPEVMALAKAAKADELLSPIAPRAPEMVLNEMSWPDWVWMVVRVWVTQ